MRSEGTELKYCYDRWGQMVRKVQTVGTRSFTLRYAYTSSGQVRTITYPDNAIVDYVRNTLDQVTEVGIKPAGGVRTVLLNNAAYEPFGPATGWTYGNGRSLANLVGLRRLVRVKKNRVRAPFRLASVGSHFDPVRRIPPDPCGCHK